MWTFRSKCPTIRVMKLGMDSNRVEILVAGTIGRLLARCLLGAGYEVILSNSRGPCTLRDAVAELGSGASAASAQEAAAAELVLLAVPWRSVTLPACSMAPRPGAARPSSTRRTR
ncbi:NAD(P)-binding domain-containing protein [Streptomyces sp900116325]|uniref:NAD(P)-binding domain-containing protein n=1 Tax=Streptomyces sp. 900116325 TaxID=3154295 RepID=UPI003323C43D